MLKRIFFGLACVIGLIASVSGQPAAPAQTANTPTETTRASVPTAPVPTEKLVPVDSVISYSERTVSDSTIDKGQRRIIQTGVNGVKTSTFKVHYLDGVEQSRELVSEVVTKQPVEQVTSVGTKSPAPVSASTSGNSYTNVDGQKVQSPTFSSTAPAGASAQCRDGSYSFSQHRQGTCSGHGGVAQWL